MDCDNSHSDNPADWIQPEDLEGKIGEEVAISCAFSVAPYRFTTRPAKWDMVAFLCPCGISLLPCGFTIQSMVISPSLGRESLKPGDYSDIGQAKVLTREYGVELRYTAATDYLRWLWSRFPSSPSGR